MTDSKIDIPNTRENFYKKSVLKFITNKEASILVCGGGNLDKQVLQDCQFTNVTISNIDERMIKDHYAPFLWDFQNAESLTYDDNSFDYVLIHAAIHHASSPHKVLTEMYRVSKIGILALEARDSFIMRLVEKTKLTQTYEHAAVFYNDCKFGGVNNTDIPNFIYRWTEREIEKTINTYAPIAHHKFLYNYGTTLPTTTKAEKRGSVKFLFVNIVKPFFYIFKSIFPRQQNLFAFYIEKPSIPKQLFPWLKFDQDRGKIIFDKIWGANQYK